MKNKGMFILLLVLFVTCLACGFLGYFQSKSSVDDEPVEKETVKYLYYVEDIEVSEIPINPVITDEEGNQTTDVLYTYSKYDCTNDLSGTWDEDNWTFNPDEERDSTCKLYFNNSKYEVTFTLSNGEASPDNPQYIEREGDGKFIITPNEGYYLDTADTTAIQCNNNKAATWNAADNSITINAIMESVACKIVFKIKTLKMDVTVVNGTGNDTVTAEYGEKVSTIVKANDGFENPTVTCTKDQKATISNNEVSIAKLTADTVCTVKYVPVAVAENTLNVTVPDSILFVTGSSSQKVKAGADGTFTLKAESGYAIDNVDCGGNVPTIEQISVGTKYTFTAMSKDISCTVTAKTSE